MRRQLLCGVGAFALALGMGACGSSSSTKPAPVNPVSLALQAPGVRTVVIPKQSSNLTIVVPPCSAAELKQEAKHHREMALRPASHEVTRVTPRTEGSDD